MNLTAISALCRGPRLLLRHSFFSTAFGPATIDRKWITFVFFLIILSFHKLGLERKQRIPNRQITLCLRVPFITRSAHFGSNLGQSAGGTPCCTVDAASICCVEKKHEETISKTRVEPAKLYCSYCRSVAVFCINLSQLVIGFPKHRSCS